MVLLHDAVCSRSVVPWRLHYSYPVYLSHGELSSRCNRRPCFEEPSDKSDSECPLCCRLDLLGGKLHPIPDFVALKPDGLREHRWIIQILRAHGVSSKHCPSIV